MEINNELYQWFKKEISDISLFKDKTICGKTALRASNYKNRFFYLVANKELGHDIHYEFYNSHIELHIEDSKIGCSLAEWLKARLKSDDKYEWQEWQNCNWKYCLLKPVETNSELIDGFKELVERVDPFIEEYSKANNDTVILQTLKLDEIFNLNIAIPGYQRIYCWSEKNLWQLWQDVISLNGGKVHHMGSVIFHKVDGETFNIVDGQQRLVSLAIILSELGQLSNNENPLLYQQFDSPEAKKYIAYNKYLIQTWVKSIDMNTPCEIIRKNLQFSVLTISSNTLDLAYTFFSNQNSKGKELSDYNLLKAHHLRYVHVEEQARHLAARWDSLTNCEAKSSNSEIALERVVGLYLFRLRKWMRKKDWNNNSKYRVKNEFESALIIPEIAPFGEKFCFYEKIQGGTHFFMYAEYFVDKFKNFNQTNQVISLREHLRWESHWCYMECIETLLFAYYLKFGTIYLTEALICIERIISRHRYDNSRALLYKVLEYVSSTEIVMMIDQATSPTFFLAETLDIIKRSAMPQIETPIKKRYNECTKQMYNHIDIDTVCVKEILKFRFI